MNVVFKPIAWQDLEWWRTQPKKDQERLFKILEEIKRTPREGSGRSERLRHFTEEFWSRRFNLIHRIVYEIGEDEITFVQLRGHYWYDR